MLKLCGFAVSNYHNKVKLALLEKGIAFEEELVFPNRDDTTLVDSPLGKVPFLKTPHGSLSESQVIVDYLEAIQPRPALIPSDPFAAAKVRELITYLELHLELVARRLYPQAFFGKTISDATKDEVAKDLPRHIAAFAKLARFAPYLAGSEFTMADCAGLVHLPLMSMATKAIYGEDLLAALPTRDYIKLLGERATVQKINADRKACVELMAQRK